MTRGPNIYPYKNRKNSRSRKTNYDLRINAKYLPFVKNFCGGSQIFGVCQNKIRKWEKMKESERAAYAPNLISSFPTVNTTALLK